MFQVRLICKNNIKEVDYEKLILGSKIIYYWLVMGFHQSLIMFSFPAEANVSIRRL